MPLALSTSAPAQAADACTTPQLSDFMVSQGLPTYGLLARGKTTLVKLFLSTPSCLPVGATVQVNGAQLSVSSSPDPVSLSASLPLPPLGPPSTAPVAGSASDVLFVVPGSALEPASGTVAFSAKVSYVVSTATGTVQDTVTFATYPGTTTALTAPVTTDALPFGMLVVPMGDGRKSADTQYPSSAREALQSGITSFLRAMPLADQGQLQWNLNPGLLDLSAYLGTDGSYCGKSSDFTKYISGQLESKRTAWNSIGTNTRAHLAFGQVWQGVSKGPSTDEGSSCLDGVAWVPGNTGWGRTIATSRSGQPLTGSIATMEVAHSTGNVHETDPRHDGSFHSKNIQADGTAPDRAYNLKTHAWISDDRSGEHYTATGWHDLNTLLEKADWDWVQCALLPQLPQNAVFSSRCKTGRLTWAGAGAPGQGTFVISGTTDGKRDGTSVYSYYSEDGRFDQPDPDSEYRLVQRGDGDAVLSETRIPVSFQYEGHDGQGAGSAALSTTGSLGAAVLDASTALAPVRRLELWRGAPGATGSTRLYEATRNAAPSFLSVDVNGRTVTISATDERPEDLRLDVFAECPHTTSPLRTAIRPTVVGTAAVFVTEADTSAACPDATLLFRITDGFSTAVDRSSEAAPGLSSGTAAIYAPQSAGSLTSYRPLALSGSGRDAAGADAARLVWSLRAPGAAEEVQVAQGGQALVRPPDGGFAAGEHDVTLRAYAVDGTLLGTAVRTVQVRLDSDGDGIADDDEARSKHPCYAEDAARDARNALLDSDGDGVANIDDPQPCTSTNNVQVVFNPESLYKSSSGQNVTVYLTSSQVDLRQLQKSDVYITQIAGYPTMRLAGSPTALAAVSWTVTDARTATAKFDRAKLVAALQAQPHLLGYVPLFIGTLDHTLRGADPAAPHVFP